MEKYKFVNYQPTDGDTHIDAKLAEEHHEEAKFEITDKQLEPSHVTVEESSMEKLLEKARTGTVNVLTEKNLDTAKNQFGSNHRDASTYEGDINKLEEQRMNKKNQVEDEKYEVASETPKKKRWWETKIKNGVKVASKINIESAFGDGDNFDFDNFDINEMEESNRYRDEESNDFDIDELDLEKKNNDQFDIEDVSPYNEIGEPVFSSNDGTPMVSGAFKVDGNHAQLGEEMLSEDLKEQILDNHPEWFSESGPESIRFVFDKLETEGRVLYTTTVPLSAIPETTVASSHFPIVTAEVDFSIEHVSKKKKKKK